jgi:hypothetical protein
MTGHQDPGVRGSGTQLWARVKRLGLCHWRVEIWENPSGRLLAQADAMSKRGARKAGHRLRAAIRALREGKL